MAYIQKANLAYATVAIAPSPALSGTSLTLASGLGSLFPAANFTITVYPPINPLVPVNPLKSNAEICLCTSRTGDVLTIVRAQEGTTAKSIATGWQVANTATALNFTEIENSIIQRISAGSTFASASEVVFSNANGVSFGASGQTITASIATNTQSTQPVAASASNGAFAFSTLGFADANGVTFGTSAGSRITASVASGVAAGSLAAGTQTMALGQVEFANSNGIVFGLSNSTLTASHNGLTSQSNQAASATNGSFAFQTIGFFDANGVTFGTSAGSRITASVAAGAAAGSISAGTTSVALGQVIFSNSGGIAFGLNGSTLTASHDGLTSQSNQAASATNGSFTFQTLGFSNANGVTFGTSAGSIITASVATAATGGGGNGLQYVFIPVQFAGNSSSTGIGFQLTGFFSPFFLDSPISFNVIRSLVSYQGAGITSAVSATAQQGWSQSFAVYSRSVTDSGATNFSNSTNWVVAFSHSQATIAGWSASSSSQSLSYNFHTDSTGGTSSISSSQFGNNLTIAVIGGGYKFQNMFYNSSLPPGEYMAFHNYSSSTDGPAAVASNLLYVTNMFLAVAGQSAAGTGFIGSLNASTPIWGGNGIYSTTLGSVPASFAQSQIAMNAARIYMLFSKT